MSQQGFATLDFGERVIGSLLHVIRLNHREAGTGPVSRRQQHASQRFMGGNVQSCMVNLQRCLLGIVVMTRMVAIL